VESQHPEQFPGLQVGGGGGTQATFPPMVEQLSPDEAQFWQTPPPDPQKLADVPERHWLPEQHPLQF
jgi:hypothetical protein